MLSFCSQKIACCFIYFSKLLIWIAPFILLRTYTLYSDILVSGAFSIVCSFSYSYSLAIQYNGKLNLTSTRFVFFIHAKSSLYNRLLDIAKTAFQKQLTSKSTVFWKVVSSDSYSNPANNLINNCPSRKYALRPVWYWSVTSSPKRSTIVFIRLLSHRKYTRTFSPENMENTSFVKFSSQRAW